MIRHDLSSKNVAARQPAEEALAAMIAAALRSEREIGRQLGRLRLHGTRLAVIARSNDRALVSANEASLVRFAIEGDAVPRFCQLTSLPVDMSGCR
ncbi:hypothetical protein [uncultured Sphingomonas sp.]|uniref:hypothetical protein n=1 Tax=uncultured Sphingomonas sp. TaxID=158754 RepID=UPI0025D31477|nr:hypothetical protein [uncultured Sphingomonas sp.]